MTVKKGKVLVAMSGGVDSSVAAAMLIEEGWEVVGVFMRLGSPGDALEDGEGCDVKIGKQGCCSINDAEDARRVSARLDMPFYVVDFKREFGRIIDYFVEEYDAGRTPNPCVRCNDWLKFGRLHAHARQIGATHVASGHYARVEVGDDGRHRLYRGLDHGKDQSYVLFGARPERLSEMLLPIGGLHKSEVRQRAEDLGLPVFDKPDSQEICFVPHGDYARLVGERSPQGISEGRLVDESGAEVGRHAGHQHFTVGQRRGIGVASSIPLFVLQKRPEVNEVVVGARESLLSPGLKADQVNWLDDRHEGWRRCSARIRYNSDPVPVEVRLDGNTELSIRFDEPQMAVAPGQAVVCYDEDLVLGGGWITGPTGSDDDSTAGGAG